MTERRTPPDAGEIEVTAIDPGYDETVVLHLGGGSWIIVDSCRDDDGTPESVCGVKEPKADGPRPLSALRECRTPARPVIAVSWSWYQLGALSPIGRDFGEGE